MKRRRSQGIVPSAPLPPAQQPGGRPHHYPFLQRHIPSGIHPSASYRDYCAFAFLKETRPETRAGALRSYIFTTWPQRFVSKAYEFNGAVRWETTNQWNPWLKRHLDAFTNEKYAVRQGDSVFRFIGLTGAGSCSKAQPLYSSVMTPTGPVPMGEIKVGDLVCTPDGGVAPVTGVFPQGEKEVFEVRFSDGSSTHCCGEHLWEVTQGQKGFFKVVDTIYVKANHRWGKRREANMGVRMPKSTFFQAQPVRIHPYLLGALLGDGALGGPSQHIGFSSVDDEILERVRTHIGDELKLMKSFRPCDYRIVSKSGKRHDNTLKKSLEYYQLRGTHSATKFIPREYLYNSVEVRQELLRGLLDTDGTAGKYGRVTLNTCSMQLAHDVKQLVLSLGGTVRISVNFPTYVYKGVKRKGQLSYVCQIRHPEPWTLFHLTRKRNRVQRPHGSTSLRYFSRVKSIGKAKVQCIAIAHPQHLYLTDNFIPTHNTHSSALFALAWWSVDPENSIVVLTSTTKDMIRSRVWSVIQDYASSAYNACTGEPMELGHLVPSQMKLLAPSKSAKHSISAYAVAHGETLKAIDNLKGLHATRMLVVIDEANGTPEAIFQVLPNYRKGCLDLTVIVIGNPVSRLDPHGRALKPSDGWPLAADESVIEWRSEGVPDWQLDPGLVLRFDGRDSPNVRVKENLYPYLYTYDNWLRAQQKVDGTGGGTFAYWSFERGMWPPEGLNNTIFTEQLFLRCDAIGTHFTFTSERIALMALDPAFGGDACMCYLGYLGDVDGRKCLQLAEHFEIPIDPSATSTDIDYQIARRVQIECTTRQVKPFCFTIDSTGVGRGVAAILAAEWSPQIQCINFGEAASERASSQNDGRPAREVYSGKVTELWFTVREALEAGQIKGFSNECVVQLCSRLYEMKGKKYQVEPKSDMKQRIRYSPDIADACALLVEAALRNGLEISGAVSQNAQRVWKQQSRLFDGLIADADVHTEGGWADPEREEQGSVIVNASAWEDS